MKRAVLSLIFAATLASVAQAQTQTPPPAQTQSPAQTQTQINETARTVIGSWEFSTAERDKRCTITLTDTRTATGLKLDFDPKCVDDFPLLRDVTGWSYPDNDLLHFLDARGKPVVDFSEVESGMYEAPTQGYGVLFLQGASDVGAPPIKPEEVAGDWAITRGSAKPLCGITLTATPAADDGFAVVVKPGCDQSITRFNFARWKIDRDELMLAPARGNPWRFEQEDANNWERVPESANPYRLVRQ